MSKIRPIALCLFRHGDRFMVFAGQDPATGLRYCRPLGGGIEFGETSQAAVVREIHEELGAELINPTLLGVVENRFTYNGKSRHEIVFVYDGQFADRRLYDQPSLPGYEHDGGEFVAIWTTLAALARDQIRLVPQEIRRFLTESDLP